MENGQLISGKAYIKIHNFRLTPKRAENLYNALHKALRHPIPLVIKSEKDQVFAVLKKEEFPTNVFKSLEIYFRIPEKNRKWTKRKVFSDENLFSSKCEQRVSNLYLLLWCRLFKRLGNYQAHHAILSGQKQTKIQ